MVKHSSLLSKETPTGILTIYTIEVAKSDKSLVAISGKFKSLDQPLRTDAKISVLRKSDNGLVAKCMQETSGQGSTSFLFPPVMNMKLLSQGGGYMAHAENFSLPAASTPICCCAANQSKPES